MAAGGMRGHLGKVKAGDCPFLAWRTIRRSCLVWSIHQGKGPPVKRFLRLTNSGLLWGREADERHGSVTLLSKSLDRLMSCEGAWYWTLTEWMNERAFIIEWQERAWPSSAAHALLVIYSGRKCSWFQTSKEVQYFNQYIWTDYLQLVPII